MGLTAEGLGAGLDAGYDIRNAKKDRVTSTTSRLSGGNIGTEGMNMIRVILRMSSNGQGKYMANKNGIVLVTRHRFCMLHEKHKRTLPPVENSGKDRQKNERHR